jgi:phage gpG-like protein
MPKLFGNTVLSGNLLGASQAAGMGFSVTTDPSPVLLVEQFNKLGLDIRSFREPLHAAVKEVIAPSLVKNFTVGGRPKWRPLALVTIAAKARQEGLPRVLAQQPLIRTGLLKKRAGQINLWNINGIEGYATLQLQSDVQYGNIHQSGAGSENILHIKATNRWTGREYMKEQNDTPGWVPQRIWAIIQPEDMKKIEKVFERWLKQRFMAAGFRP